MSVFIRHGLPAVSCVAAHKIVRRLRYSPIVDEDVRNQTNKFIYRGGRRLAKLSTFFYSRAASLTIAGKYFQVNYNVQVRPFLLQGLLKLFIPF